MLQGDYRFDTTFGGETDARGRAVQPGLWGFTRFKEVALPEAVQLVRSGPPSAGGSVPSKHASRADIKLAIYGVQGSLCWPRSLGHEIIFGKPQPAPLVGRAA